MRTTRKVLVLTDHRTGTACFLHDRVRVSPLRCKQCDAGAYGVLLRRVARPQQVLKPCPFFR